MKRTVKDIVNYVGKTKLIGGIQIMNQQTRSVDRIIGEAEQRFKDGKSILTASEWIAYDNEEFHPDIMYLIDDLIDYYYK